MKTTSFTSLTVLALALALAATGCKQTKPRPTPLGNAGASKTVPARTGSGDTTTTGPGAGTPLTGGETPAVGGDVMPAAGGDVIGGPGKTGGGELTGDFSNPDLFNQDRAVLAEQTVYFAFDSAAVKSDQLSKVDAVAAYLKANPLAGLLIEGHCDERGTEEYNRALGERRALGLREVLVNAGVDYRRVTTRSWGEDKPADPGQNETAWARNRRGEFTVLTAK